MRYRHLIQEERYQISALHEAGWSQGAIAARLGRAASSISRELNRNRVFESYQPQVVGLLAMALCIWHSGSISNVANGAVCVSGAGTIPNWVSIDQRPAIVADRQRYGDWEADLVVGARHSQALVTINERKSRYALITRVASKQAAGVSQAIIEQLNPFAHMAHTLTTDSGKEFVQHERIATELKLGYYFAHPHAAWERGANENLNGLLRQFFPKHRKLEEVTDEEIALAQHRLNHRPRKCLGYKTPHQVFWEQLHSNQPIALRC
jgi:IS30 family transposase